MSQSDHKLFDSIAVTHARRRGFSLGPDGSFLRTEIASRLADRLLDIRRKFENIIDLGGDCGMENATIIAPNIGPNTERRSHRSIDADTLPLIEEEADLIITNLYLHSQNDPVGTLIQACKALKPDGLFLASLFGGETLYELRHALLTAEIEITGRAAPRVAPFADVRAVGELLGRAGLALPVADQDRITITYDHPLNLMQDLRKMGEVNSLAERSRYFLRRDVLMRACDIYQEKYSMTDGRIPATFDVIYLTGWRPHESQQKPLKPGSGKISLSDALKSNKAPKQP